MSENNTLQNIINEACKKCTMNARIGFIYSAPDEKIIENIWENMLCEIGVLYGVNFTEIAYGVMAQIKFRIQDSHIQIFANAIDLMISPYRNYSIYSIIDNIYLTWKIGITIDDILATHTNLPTINEMIELIAESLCHSNANLKKKELLFFCNEIDEDILKNECVTKSNLISRVKKNNF